MEKVQIQRYDAIKKQQVSGSKQSTMVSTMHLLYNTLLNWKPALDKPLVHIIICHYFFKHTEVPLVSYIVTH